MKSRIGLIFTMLILVSFVLSACTPAAPTAAPVSEEPVVEEPAAPAEEASAAKPLIVAFVHSSTNSFVAKANQGIIDQAKKLGYDVKVFEDNFNQAEQDTLVQQFLASGEKAAGFVMDPADDLGGIASLKKLTETGAPIVALNRLPVDAAKPFITAYAGVSHVESGRESGRTMLKARDEAIANGVKLHNPQGNFIEIEFPLSNTGGKMREQGFTEATKDAPFNILAREPAAGYSPDDAYTLMSQLLAKYKDQGVDFVFAHNDQLALGAIRALEEAGYKPGKDVFVIGGTCHGDLSAVENGTQYATNIEPAYLSGSLSVDVLNKIITGSKPQEGETQLAKDPNTMPSLPDKLTYYTYEPILGVTQGKESVDSAKLWGIPMRELCDY